MDEDIIELVSDAEAKAYRESRKAAIISPGAIGDCLLMLPLAEFILEQSDLGGIELIGHSEYIDFYPGRTCVDSIRSIDAIDLHRLFAASKSFDVEQNDALVNAMDRYEWIISFLGDGNSDFERNLIFVINCSRPADVTILPLLADDKFDGHISDYYIRKFAEKNPVTSTYCLPNHKRVLVTATEADKGCGRDILGQHDVDASGRLAVIHPGSGGASKCWHVDNFCRVAEHLSAKNIKVVFLLGPAETERFDKETLGKIEGCSDAVLQVGLTEVVRVLSCCDVYIGNDSGTTHAAGCMGIRTLAVFGPSDMTRYGPMGPEVRCFKASSASFEKVSESAAGEVIEIISGMV